MLLLLLLLLLLFTTMQSTAAVFVNTACIMCIISTLGRVEPTTAVITRDVNETEMFYHEIRPELFNWTNGADSRFVFTPSLQNYPDLLHWIYYKFDDKNRHGYLYGTPPTDSLDRKILLDIIGLNKKTYQIETQVIQLNILEKSEYATNEVRFKINNLNVEDMFHEERIPYLLDIFRQNLWLGSKENLYVTFLASASDLGQRLPLDPNDTEGVIVNLGSSSNFSTMLYDLQKEISPLQKMNKCPKDFKRTSVERYFRANGFNLDWCSFKLVELPIINKNQTMNVQDKLPSTKQAKENVWELMESLQYTQSMHTDASKFIITLFIFVIFLIGITFSIGVCRWHKKKDIFLKK